MGSMILQVAQRQSQTLSPRLQQAVRLLQMSSVDFAAVLRDTLGRNPFLEADELAEGVDDEPFDDGAVLPDRAAAEWDAHDDLRPADAVIEGGSDFDAHDPMNDRDLWQGDGVGNGARSAGDDSDPDGADRLMASTTLNGHLHAQLGLLPLSDRQALLAAALIESLDDDGYLRTPLPELQPALAAQALTDPAATLAELEQALAHVQSLEPAGVGARSVAECLTLQLPAIDCPRMRCLAGRVVTAHLQALAARDIGGLAKKLDATPAETAAVCDRIRRLDPRPGHQWAAPLAPYVVPDVVVRKLRGQWVAQLNPAVVPRLRLNQVYAQLYAQHRGLNRKRSGAKSGETSAETSAETSGGELGLHLQEARWTLRNVEQRFSTILEVAQAIVRRQQAFLEFGSMAMKPLALKEIADEVGVHESTVSRVTNNKYIATPIGVFELKYFFSRAMISANGSACSATAIRSLIQDIIGAEAPSEPLSDAEIARQLAVQGLTVARRTVTKYRQLLKIEAVERRRRLA